MCTDEHRHSADVRRSERAAVSSSADSPAPRGAPHTVTNPNPNIPNVIPLMPTSIGKDPRATDLAQREGARHHCHPREQ